MSGSDKILYSILTNMIDDRKFNVNTKYHNIFSDRKIDDLTQAPTLENWAFCTLIESENTL